MEGQKDVPRLDIADGHLRFHAAAPRRNANPIPGLHADFLRIMRCDLQTFIRRGRPQCRRASRLCAGVEMLDESAGREQERIILVRLFGGRHTMRRLEDRAAGRIIGAIFLGRNRGAGHQVMPERLAIVGVAREHQ